MGKDWAGWLLTAASALACVSCAAPRVGSVAQSMADPTLRSPARATASAAGPTAVQWLDAALAPDILAGTRASATTGSAATPAGLEFGLVSATVKPAASRAAVLAPGFDAAPVELVGLELGPRPRRVGLDGQLAYEEIDLKARWPLRGSPGAAHWSLEFGFQRLELLLELDQPHSGVDVNVHSDGPSIGLLVSF